MFQANATIELTPSAHLIGRRSTGQIHLARFASTPRQIAVRKLSAQDLQWLPALCDLLIDGVHQGASLGFLAPMSRYAAMDYWHGVYARLGSQQSLWVACETDGNSTDGPLQGAVQLSLGCEARHRGEVQRLMVHSQARGRGIASRLMQRVECAAAEQGRTLLVLDAPSGSQAEAVYVHLGWQRAGEIPDYAASAEGQLHSCAMYYKRLSA
ncbi:MAG TPA: GNAT family N-acetyltransferase [Burkholderiaceae bacterium]|jgi:ribosomal protein S18 acetylase RimI-like enzyme